MHSDELADVDLDTPPEKVDRLIAMLAREATQWSTSDPEDPFCWPAYARLRWVRCVQRRSSGLEADPADVDAAIAAFDVALALFVEDPAIDDYYFATLVFLLADALTARHAERTDRTDDLDRAIGVTAGGLELVAPGTPIWCDNMAALGGRQFDRYRITLHDDDFAVALETFRSLLAVGGQDPEERMFTWTQVSLLHDTRHRSLSCDDDLDESITALRAARAEGHRDPGLIIALADQLVRRGQRPDVAEAVAMLDSVAAVDVSAADRAACDAIVLRSFLGLYQASKIGYGAGDSRHLEKMLHLSQAVLENEGAEPLDRDIALLTRALARVEQARISKTDQWETELVIADLEEVRDRFDDDLRMLADKLLAMGLQDRAQASQSQHDIDRAAAFAAEVWERSGEVEAAVTLAYALILKIDAGLGDRADLDRAMELLTWSEEQRPDDPEIAAAASGGIGLLKVYRGLLWGDDADLDTAINHLNVGFAVVDRDSSTRTFLLVGLISALMYRYENQGDLADLRRCRQLAADAQDGHLLSGGRRSALEAIHGQVQFHWFEVTGDLEALTNSLRSLTSCLAGLPSGSAQRPRILRFLALAHMAHAMQVDDDAEVRAAAEMALRAIDECRPGIPGAHVVMATAVAVLPIAAVALKDAALARIAVERIESAIASLEDRPNYGRIIGGFGFALVLLANNGGTEADRRRGIRLLQDAYEILLSTPGAPTLGVVAMTLGEAYAAQGDLGQAIEVGRTALVGWAWMTLLQTGTHNAMSAVRQSAENALTVARWCLRDGRMEEAYQALEAGRGLVLHAATVTATFADLLRAAGHGDLADEWIAAAPAGLVEDARDWRIGVPALPSDLRHRALMALADHPLLFDPPSVATTAAALATLRCDALVYLFPGAASDAGLALIVGVDGEVAALDLPELTAEWAESVGTGRPVTREILVPAAVDRPLDLDRVVEAAWSAAIGPLLAHWRRTHSSHPRFFLVPAGKIAAIPWHAAYEPSEGRWAIDEADFSAIASGRLLIEIAARQTMAPSTSALIIGNPDTGEAGDDLPGAGHEASTIHRRFFPDGTYRGRPDPPSTGPGVAADVLDWLTGRDVPHAPVLHLACHGTVRSDGPATSSLRLSDGELSAEEILRTAASRPPATSLGLVSLAACTTHRAGRDYDEAVTLSTAFVVAGASTAIGSLWRVPDRETALLMIAFYENLLVHAMPPRDALRHAQRWLRDLPGTPLSGWAGFVHIGA